LVSLLRRRHDEKPRRCAVLLQLLWWWEQRMGSYGASGITMLAIGTSQHSHVVLMLLSVGCEREFCM
jgi:hypothetical protein